MSGATPPWSRRRPSRSTGQDRKGAVHVVLDASGTPTVAWRRGFRVLDTDPRTRTAEASSTVSGVWMVPTTLGTASDRSGLGLTIDAAGTVTAAWPSEGFDRSGLGDQARGGRGMGRCPWHREWSRTHQWCGSGRKPAGRRRRGLRIRAERLRVPGSSTPGPSTSMARWCGLLSIPGHRDGRPVGVSYAVTAPDAWSATSSVWSFSDGTTASGASVTHTYANAGTYTVTVTVTDAVGNARTRTGTTVVAAAPVVTPPAATPKPTLTGVKLTKKIIHVKGSDESTPTGDQGSSSP